MPRLKDRRQYVVAFKELINEIVDQLDKESAIKYIVDEVLSRAKEVFSQGEYEEIKAYAEEKLGMKLPD